MDKKDIFYLDKVFPEAAKIFSENFKEANEIIKDCIIILDTNILLIPFDTNEKNVNEIKGIYQKYKKENRLFIPARVAREFANNRGNRIADVFLKVRQIKENLNTGHFKISQYPILDNNPDYIELKKQFETIQLSIKKSKECLDNIENHIQSWTWNDNVSLAYNEIFTPEIIIEVRKKKEDLEKDLEFRTNYKVAPGFKDSKKVDDGIGDLIIWQTILEIGENLGKDIIFVTNDQKNDWFYKQDKITLYPKYELFDEFRRITKGKSISIINYIKFLELSKAKATTIKEIKTSIEKNSFKDEFETGLELVEGLEVEHSKFGIGTVIKNEKRGIDQIATINFKDLGHKQLLVRYAALKILDTKLNFILLNPGFDFDEDNQS